MQNHAHVPKKCAYLCSHVSVFILVPYIKPTRNERGLIGDRHVVNKRAAANQCGDLFVGALKICEVVLHVYKHDYVLQTSKNPILTFVFIYTSHIHNKTSL